jgi:hypothetical protein
VYFNGVAAPHAGLETEPLVVPTGLTNVTQTIYFTLDGVPTSTESRSGGWGGYGFATMAGTPSAMVYLALDAQSTITGRPMPTMLFAVTSGGGGQILATDMGGGVAYEIEQRWQYLGQTDDVGSFLPWPKPILLGASPPVVSPNATVTIRGFGLAAATAVTVGTAPATVVTATDTSVTIVVPPGQGSANVTVTLPTGTLTSTFQLHYVT